VVHNPLIVIPPEGRREDLAQNETAPVSQADIFATLLDLLSIGPVRPVDGLSLLRPVPAGRLRICSEYMPTFHNNPTAVLFLPDFRFYKIDFTKKSVLMPDGISAIPYAALKEPLKSYIDKRLGE
jgi:hypothetical protein